MSVLPHLIGSDGSTGCRNSEIVHAVACEDNLGGAFKKTAVGTVSNIPGAPTQSVFNQLLSHFSNFHLSVVFFYKNSFF
jgi:hypothetical protein